MLLAALAEPKIWQTELERLRHSNGTAFNSDKRLVRELEALSGAAVPSTSAKASPASVSATD